MASVGDTVNSKRRKWKISHVVYSDKRIKTLLQDTSESLLKDLASIISIAKSCCHTVGDTLDVSTFAPSLDINTWYV